MSNEATRRQFLRHGAAAAIGTACAGVSLAGPAARSAQGKEGERPVPPTGKVFQRNAGPRLKVSCCAYSFNKYLPRGKNPGKMTMDDFVDLCAKLDLDGTELTSYYFPPDADTAYFRRIRRRAFLNGLEVSGTAVGNTFTLPPGEARDKQIAMVKQWIDRAGDFAAPTIRLFAGSVPKGGSVEQGRKWFLECMEQVLPHAEKQGVFLALENHGGIVTTADQVLACVEPIKSDWFGVNLDTGNFREPNPYAAMARCAPYAVNVHLKVEVHSTTKGSAPADFVRIAGILRKAGYRGYVSLEYEAKEDPNVGVPKQIEAIKAAIGKNV
ncbi:MAG: sugar phosphate isomerase/epimerase [Phycisphaerae bacterium]|nr:sugar phosphate isomerase/epimerase [Phycisphaerae bacterium]